MAWQMKVRIDHVVWVLAVTGVLLTAVALLAKRSAERAALAKSEAMRLAQLEAAAVAQANASYESEMAKFAAEATWETNGPDHANQLSDQTDGSEESAFSILAWNVESDGNDPDVIAKRLETFNDDVICLSEVHPENVERYESALESYTPMLSRSGGNDRLMILASPRFRILERIEHDEINDGRHRAPLSMRLQDEVTGTRFIVMTAHLARGNADFRTEQAHRMVEWARNEADPIIAIGDFNMDYEFQIEKGNDAFVEIVRDGVFRWLAPVPLADTNWFDGNGDGRDDYPGSMLDFAFAANGALEWDIDASVIVEQGDFPDDDATSDHRPIRALIKSTVVE